MVAEVVAYILRTKTLKGVLPSLLEKSMQRGYRSVVSFSSQERVREFDDYLWTYKEDSFLPHGRIDQVFSERQPVLLAENRGYSGSFDVLFLVDGLYSATSSELKSFERICIVLSGIDDKIRKSFEGLATEHPEVKMTCWFEEKAASGWVKGSCD